MEKNQSEHLYGPNRNHEPVLSLLTQNHILTVTEATRISQLAQEKGYSAIAYLIEQKEVPPLQIATALAQHLQLDYLDLNTIDIKQLPRNILNDAWIKTHQALPLRIENGLLYLAIQEPKQLTLSKEVAFSTSLSIQPVIVEYDKLAHLITEYLTDRSYQMLKQPLCLHTEHNDQRIIHLVQHTLEDAIRRSASDIHLEPQKSAYRIRFRIDGILHNVVELSIELAQRITARLKILAKLDIAEKRLPQDGRFPMELKPFSKDCRISTCPTLFGEKMVVRILENNPISLKIEDLGMENAQQELFLKTIQKPQGLILVTGPTGSGKTLTLYSALNLLNTLDKNISSIEDPIEIELPGLNQVNINPKANLTFASILRAFLRQDPDILMVGEIRDKETADIAIHAAQTGHLVFSTLHANNTLETATRLEMMEIAPLNFIDATRLIIAQRLVRKLCGQCKLRKSFPEHTLIQAGFSPKELNDLVLYTPTGCDSCTAGYRGRTGVFELLPVTEELKSDLIKKTTLQEIKKRIQAEGWMNLNAIALNKARAGITSLEEVHRVILQ